MYPKLFSVGPLTVHTYGTLLAVAFIAGILMLHRNAHLVSGLKRDRVVDATLFLLVASLVGARLMFVLLNWKEFDSIVAIISVQKGGLSFHGGLLGGILGIALFCRFYKVKFLPLVDALSPAAALGYGFTKIGCFLNGCCLGRPTDLPWGVCFPDPHAMAPGVLTAPSHPAQIYDSLLNVLMCLLLLRVLHRKRFQGQVFYAWLIVYSAVRFFIECYRKGVTASVIFSDMTAEQAAQAPMFGWPLTQAQFASALVIILVGAFVIIKLRGAPKEPLPIPAPPPADEDKKADDAKSTRRRKDRKARRRRESKSRED